jgi:hypothetical protein
MYFELAEKNMCVCLRVCVCGHIRVYNLTFDGGFAKERLIPLSYAYESSRRRPESHQSHLGGVNAWEGGGRA